MGEEITRVAEYLRDGGVVAYPTETVWGLGVDPYSIAGVDQLLYLKQRPEDKGLPLIADCKETVVSICRFSSHQERELFEDLTKRHWPGPLTVVLDPERTVAERIDRRVMSTDGSLAVRVSSLLFARKLASATGGLIVATSANKSGRPPARTLEEVQESFPGVRTFAGQENIAGSENQPSTIVDLRSGSVRIIRQGAVRV